MKLYNTLSKQVETIRPLNAPATTVYTCGPTVYDYPHIGNWFTFVRYDLLIRGLKLEGLEPTWVMNITDVGHLVSDDDDGEDKLEKGARREGKNAWDVAQFYTDYFAKGLERLNITQPTQLPKATDHIAEQIALVQSLAAKSYTYTIDDGVYFDTSKFPDYAKFAQLDVDEQQAGKRVEFNVQKRNSTDFALWKFSPIDEKRDMEWESPFTGPDGQPRKGFPGWHLECSAMAMKYLGETIDIHSGGIDHIAVHHTNEIAQSQAVTGKPFANYWMHTNHITIEGEKVSKSLGNGITLEDIEAKGFDLEVLRLHILESHYRSQSKFSWESLEAARNRLQGYRALAALAHQPKPVKTNASDLLKNTLSTLRNHMLDDLNTPMVLATLSGVSDALQSSLVSDTDVTGLKNLLSSVDTMLGLKLSDVADISDAQKELIAQREVARQSKDWTTSDALRDQLIEQHIGLRDTASGAIWYCLTA